MSKMKLNSLQPLDIVKLRSGRILIVMPNPNSKNGLSLNDDSLSCVYYLSDYLPDLCRFGYKNKDIVAVCKNSLPSIFSIERTRRLISNTLNEDMIPWDWVRKEPEKEMTVEEIEAALGYKIKIVGEHTDN